MPKRRVYEPTKYTPRDTNPLEELLRRESQAYLAFEQDKEKLKNLRGQELIDASADICVRMVLLEELSENVDKAIADYHERRTNGTLSENPIRNSEGFQEAESLLTNMLDTTFYKAINRTQINRAKQGARLLYKELGEEKPLPDHILISLSTSNLDADVAKQMAELEKNGELEPLLRNGFDFGGRWKVPDPEPEYEGKRRVTDPTFLKPEENESVQQLKKEEFKTYVNVQKAAENPDMTSAQTAVVFQKAIMLNQASERLDELMDEYKKNAEGDTEPINDEGNELVSDFANIRGFIPGQFENRYKNEIESLDDEIFRFKRAMKDTFVEEEVQNENPEEEPEEKPEIDDISKHSLPLHFLPLVTAEPKLTDEQVLAAIEMERRGELKSYLEENGYYTFERQVEGPLNEKKPLESLFGAKENQMEENQAEDLKDEEKDGEEQEEKEEKEEKLTEEQVNQRRDDVESILAEFFRRILAAADPTAVLRNLAYSAFKPFDNLKVGGVPFTELHKEEADIKDPVERETKLGELLNKDLAEGDKQITFQKPEVLTNGKVVPGDEVVLKESAENLQALVDNQQKYNILLDQQLKELNLIKEEFGKTQDLPKANFDGKNKEGSDFYQNMTSKLQHCINVIEEIKSGKTAYSPDVLQGALNGFKESCETYVENRKGTLFGPVTEKGQKRLSLGNNGIEKVDRMVKDIDAYTNEITSKVIVNDKGQTFDLGLNTKEKEQYIKNLVDSGKVKEKPEAEAEHEICLEQLKKISTLDYVFLDFSKEKNGQYQEAARDVILGIHNNIVNHGQKATNYDVNRIRNFDISLKNMAENSVFRSLVDKEGVKATIEKWPEIEKRTDALRESIKNDYENRLTEQVQKGQFTYKYGMSVSEYVAGIGSPENRKDINRNHTPESKIRQFEVNEKELNSAYDRMTEVITDKLLLENDKFGREFLNAQASNLLDQEKTPDGKTVTNTFNMTVNDVDVRTQLNNITKQILVQNHVLEGKKLPKALKQLESGKLGEDLVNSIKAVYRNEMKKSKDLNIKAENTELETRMAEQGLIRSEEKQKEYASAKEMQTAYIREAKAERDSLAAEEKGFMKDGKVDQEKIQKIIKAVAGDTVERNRGKFLTKESITNLEKSFYQRKDFKMGILSLAEKYTGSELAKMIKDNDFARNLNEALRENAKTISQEEMKKHPELATQKYNLVKAAGNLKVPDNLMEAPEQVAEPVKAPVKAPGMH